MREWEIGAVENIHGALPYIRFAPLLALVGVGVNRIGKQVTFNGHNYMYYTFTITYTPRDIYGHGATNHVSHRSAAAGAPRKPEGPP